MLLKMIDPIDVLLLHAAQRGQHVILFAHSLFGPFDGELVVPGIGFHPVLVIIGALAENFLAHHRNTKDLADKVNHLLRPGKPVQIAVDDDPVETVIYKHEKTAEQPCEQLHGSITPQGKENADGP